MYGESFSFYNFSHWAKKWEYDFSIFQYPFINLPNIKEKDHLNFITLNLNSTIHKFIDAAPINDNQWLHTAIDNEIDPTAVLLPHPPARVIALYYTPSILEARGINVVAPSARVAAPFFDNR